MYHSAERRDEDEQNIAQNLRDAGCRAEDAAQILECWRRGELVQMRRQIDRCRSQQLERLHESQRCIDRLDYLCYRLEREG